MASRLTVQSVTDALEDAGFRVKVERGGLSTYWRVWAENGEFEVSVHKAERQPKQAKLQDLLRLQR